VRYLILSDIHANLQALETVLTHAGERGYDRVVVLGDLVGYGADPGAVIDRVVALSPAAMIRGNHDKVCAGIEEPINFNDTARESVEWTAKQLSQAQLEMLTLLPKGPKLLALDPLGMSPATPPRIEICHGAPFDEDYYVFSTEDAARALEASSAPICFFGHTHVQGAFIANDPRDRPGDLGDGEIRLPEFGYALVNVGAVGQPRDGDPRAGYGIVDSSKNTLSLFRVEYDIAAAQKRIRDARLPEWLAVRLERGL
jgi:diadenosine tetraphosphatase ApaH/serine/threonine PP2A family protein phosphatase